VELACKIGQKNCKPACAYGVLVPDRDLDQAETETYWIEDRASLRNCRNSFTALQNYYDALRTYLSTPED
jgi:hypothetical protein